MIQNINFFNMQMTWVYSLMGHSLRNALNLVDQYSKYSGLTPNLEKTKCIWIGSKKGSNDKLCEEIDLDWTDEPFVVLGIKFSTKLEEMMDFNFDKDKTDENKLISLGNMYTTTLKKF